MKSMEYVLNEDGEKVKSKPPSLTRAIFRAFWFQYMKVGVLILIQALVLRTLQPIFQGLVIKYFNGDDTKEVPTRDEVLCYAAGLILTTLGITFIMHHSNLGAQQIGMRIRIACCSLVYRKVSPNSPISLKQKAKKNKVTFTFSICG